MSAEMRRRVAVVTGSNKGIGYGIVMGLCKSFDGDVYLTSRDVGRGKTAVEEMKALGLNPHFHQLDIDDEQSVVTLRDFLVEKYGGLDILVNNAAIYYPMSTPKEEYAEKARKVITTNYFNTLRACDILFPILRPHARVVNLTSDDGHLLKIAGKEPEATNLKNRFAAPDLTIEQLNKLMQEFIEAAERGDYVECGWPNGTDWREDFWPNEPYMVSKVGISAMTFIQQSQFDKDERQDLIVNCVHPGYVQTSATNFQGDKNIEEGAEASVHFALLPPSTDDQQVLKGCYVWWNKEVVDWVNGPVPEHY